MSLYISTRRTDPSLANSEIDKAIVYLSASTALHRHQHLLPEHPNLELTFILPGDGEKPPFHGWRIEKFSNEKQTLQVQAAIPRSVCQSEDSHEYLKVVLEGVIDDASSYFSGSDNAVDFDRQSWRQAIRGLLP